MEDKKSEKKSGIRTDISPSEMWENLNRTMPKTKSERAGGKIRRFFERLSSFGLFPVLSKDSHEPIYDSKTQKNNSSDTSTFKEQQQFNPEDVHVKREAEEAYLNSTGYKKEELILTEEEYIKRKQEDAYMKMVDGKGDDER